MVLIYSTYVPNRLTGLKFYKIKLNTKRILLDLEHEHSIVYG